ncbi:MAG: lipoyl synthase [Kiritimatiellae bacterium]|nr:lipoyl synthase [Kiritimatiellia bacterium]
MRKPDWLRVRLGHGGDYARLRGIIESNNLRTVCSDALCPNRGECWENGRATLMILGEVCSRHCTFCNVSDGVTGVVDTDEPVRVAAAVKEMGLDEVVITSVTRDDLEDGGALIWAETITRIREAVPGIMLEVLIPDFAGNEAALDVVLRVSPDVLGHNLETIQSLYSKVRPEADYHRSLDVLAHAHQSGLITKSGIMLGLGEGRDDVLGVMQNLIDVGCDIFSMGQYLQPTKKHLPVMNYVTPAEFEEYKEDGLKMGFKVVVSGPLVRSSYHSDEQSEWVDRRLRLE